jgi:Xaa-Pro aminopeptidase
MTQEMPEKFEGDEALSRRLSARGASVPPAAIRSLIAGVVGAPKGWRPDAWVDLVVPDADAALRGQLLALEREISRSSDDGLDEAPAPAERLAALREELARLDLDGFIVPRTDAHQGEYVPPHDERLRWLTGFSGSAGMAVVLRDRAAIFVDGRYTLQVRNEVDTGLIEPVALAETPPAEWIAVNLPAGAKLAYDPWLHSENAVQGFQRAVQRAGASLVPVAENPVDSVWPQQPAAPIAPIVSHDVKYAGKESAEKRAEIGAALQSAKCDAAVLTTPDSIAWLLNIRGGDVPRAPMPLSFAIVHGDGSVDLFVDPRKLAPGLGRHLGNGVSVVDVGEFPAALSAMKGKTVRVDPTTVAAFVVDRLSEGEATISRGDDPCALPKACKNTVEIAGSRAAHRRDGAALTRFLAWFAKEAPTGRLTEIEASARLQDFRFGDPLIRDLSFDTISGSGPNGAIVHYRVSPRSDRRMQPGELFLVDSGAQYLDGTTDVTRTIAVGMPSDETRDRFTRVLKGHIAIARARFPDGTSGAQLDLLARQALWDAGLDFDHGTGHGVGSYLSVHEGPHRISKAPNSVALRPGMIVSNEPGYYKTGEYGIRIENLVTVVPCAALAGADRKFYEFETLTLAPIDRNLVDVGLMTEPEIQWFDAYHARVREAHLPRLDAAERGWLEAATAPL